MTDNWRDRRTDSKNNVSLAYPYHKGKSCIKSKIQSCGLDYLMDGQTDSRQRCSQYPHR